MNGDGHVKALIVHFVDLFLAFYAFTGETGQISRRETEEWHKGKDCILDLNPGCICQGLLGLLRYIKLGLSQHGLEPFGLDQHGQKVIVEKPHKASVHRQAY